MSYEVNEENQFKEQLENQRREKVNNFKLNIKEDTSENYEDDFEEDKPKNLTSYSGEDVKEKMAKNSKKAMKKAVKHEKRQRKKRNRKNKRVFKLAWWAAVIVVGSMAGMFIVDGINDLLAIKRTDENFVNVVIPENPTIDSVTQVLVDNKVIKDGLYFKLFATLTKSADSFTPGAYDVKRNLDYEALINLLLSDVEDNKEYVTVTIPEGQTVKELAQILVDNKVLSDVGTFLELCNSTHFDEDYNFLSEITNGADRYYKLEGYLFPDTYDFYIGETPENIIYTMLNNYEYRISEKVVDRHDEKVRIKELVENSGYSIDEIMIIASIIQAEAANSEDMYYVSSVLHNRLTADADMGVSFLSLDSTKFYPYRKKSDLPENIRNTFESSYDTYVKKGLPDGEICNPGTAAILAALEPYETDYYYFCHDKDGKPYYASTFVEHNENLNKLED